MENSEKIASSKHSQGKKPKQHSSEALSNKILDIYENRDYIPRQSQTYVPLKQKPQERACDQHLSASQALTCVHLAENANHKVKRPSSLC